MYNVCTTCVCVLNSYVRMYMCTQLGCTECTCVHILPVRNVHVYTTWVAVYNRWSLSVLPTESLAYECTCVHNLARQYECTREYLVHNQHTRTHARTGAPKVGESERLAVYNRCTVQILSKCTIRTCGTYIYNINVQICTLVHMYVYMCTYCTVYECVYHTVLPMAIFTHTSCMLYSVPPSIST